MNIAEHYRGLLRGFDEQTRKLLEAALCNAYLRGKLDQSEQMNAATGAILRQHREASEWKTT